MIKQWIVSSVRGSIITSGRSIQALENHSKKSLLDQLKEENQTTLSKGGSRNFLEFWENLEEIFVKTNEMREHQIENEMISLSPSSFESLQLYFSKFKALVLQLKQCGIEKKEDKLVLAILLKLGPDYSVFF